MPRECFLDRVTIQFFYRKNFFFLAQEFFTCSILFGNKNKISLLQENILLASEIIPMGV